MSQGLNVAQALLQAASQTTGIAPAVLDRVFGLQAVTCLCGNGNCIGWRSDMQFSQHIVKTPNGPMAEPVPGTPGGERVQPAGVTAS